MGGDAVCWLFGLGAGRRTCLLGTPHSTFSQAHILDMALEPARSFASSSSAQVTTPQLHNFPGRLLISASLGAASNMHQPHSSPSQGEKQPGSAEEF